MQLIGAISQLSSKSNDLRNNQLCHTARIGEGGVEDCDTLFGGIIEIDLVGTDAEATDDNQILRLAEDLFAKLGLGSDADDMNVSTRIYQHSHYSVFLNRVIYRIFSINSASGKELLIDSTW